MNLIEWNDVHASSCVPTDFIAKDVVAEYETPWWTAAKEANESAWRNLVDSGDSHNVDNVDADGRTTLLFVAGLGSESCVKLLVEAGANLDHCDRSGGLVVLHMVAGYVRHDVTKLLLDLSADPEVADDRGRTALDLAREILMATSKGNPMHSKAWLGSIVAKVQIPLESMAVSYVHMVQSGRGFHKGNLSYANCSYKGRRTNRLVFACMQTSDPKVDSLLDSVKWDNKGLAVAIAQNVDTGAILMQGFANREAVATTLSSRKATFYSRSRSTLWTKGETSNNFINVLDVFLDCDRDSIIYLGKPDGPTCHTGAETCYYTSVFDLLRQQEDEGNNLALTSLYALESTISQRKTELTGENEKPSWTKRLLLNDKLLCSKIREEANELCQTLENNEHKSRTASEMADVLYHAMVLLAKKAVKIEDVLQVLRLRFSQSGIEEKRSRVSQKPLDH